jgi:anti-sigma factor (TIGR02949 family)
MLSCQDCERYLYAFLDQALDIKETLDIQAHLRACTPCADRAAAERTLRAFVRQHATVPALPQEVKQRIIRQAMQASRPQRWWAHLGVVRHMRDFVTGVAAAALLLLAFSSFLSPSRSDDPVQKYVNEASMWYATYKTQHLPPEVESADDTVVTRWFNNHMGSQLKVPCITDTATKLLGGRLCRLGDRKSAALMYQRNGVDILLFAFKGDRLSLPAKRMIRTKDRVFYLQSVGGRPVAMWQHGGITYSMVGDMPPDELLQVATTINYR